MRMPITIRNRGDLLVVAFSGVITKSELLKGAQEMAELEAREPVTPSRLNDLTAVTDLEIEFETMHQFSLLRKESPLKNATRSAIVVSNDLQFGFARMYQTMNGNPQLEIRVFRDQAEALAWLELR